MLGCSAGVCFDVRCAMIVMRTEEHLWREVRWLRRNVKGFSFFWGRDVYLVYKFCEVIEGLFSRSDWLKCDGGIRRELRYIMERMLRCVHGPILFGEAGVGNYLERRLELLDQWDTEFAVRHLGESVGIVSI